MVAPPNDDGPVDKRRSACMKAIQLAKPGGLDRLVSVDIEESGALAPGDILVRIHASSLNFHDFAVVSGRIPTRDGRIPMSDGRRVGRGGRRRGEGVRGGRPCRLLLFPNVAGRAGHDRRLCNDSWRWCRLVTRVKGSCGRRVGLLIRRRATPMRRQPL